MNLYLATLTELQDRFDAATSPARRFQLLAEMARCLDDVIYITRETLRGKAS